MSKKILRFTASWCQPCKMLAKNLEEVKPSLPIDIIDIDTNTDMAIHYSVRGVPTLVIVDENNTEVKRMVGLVDQQTLKNWIEA